MKYYKVSWINGNKYEYYKVENSIIIYFMNEDYNYWRIPSCKYTMPDIESLDGNKVEWTIKEITEEEVFNCVVNNIPYDFENE